VVGQVGSRFFRIQGRLGHILAEPDYAALLVEITEFGDLAEDKSLFRLAAELKELDMSEFLVSTAREAAERAIEDQRDFVLSPERYAAFVAALDRPPVEPLQKTHDLGEFHCGKRPLDEWLRKFALSSAASEFAQTYVVHEERMVRG
jgi:uncharacterized protein (DUF1778 family)